MTSNYTVTVLGPVATRLASLMTATSEDLLSIAARHLPGFVLTSSPSPLMGGAGA